MSLRAWLLVLVCLWSQVGSAIAMGGGDRPVSTPSECAAEAGGCGCEAAGECGGCGCAGVPSEPVVPMPSVPPSGGPSKDGVAAPLWIEGSLLSGAMVLADHPPAKAAAAIRMRPVVCHRSVPMAVRYCALVI